MEKQVSIVGKQVAIIAADGVDEGALFKMKSALEEKGLNTQIISNADSICGSKGNKIIVDQKAIRAYSENFDGIYVPGGEDSIFTLQGESSIIRFINEAYRSSKPIAVEKEGEELLYVTAAGSELGKLENSGVLVNRSSRDFVKAIGQLKQWSSNRISA